MEKEFDSEFRRDEIYAWIDEVLSANPKRRARGIAVSNALYERGISGNHREIPIAADPQLWPANVVRVEFDDEDAA